MTTEVDADEQNLLVVLAGCSLAKTPEKDNWVDDAGGLPKYICRIARAIHKSGKAVGPSIAIAVSRVKKWASGVGDVDADTRAKATTAVAQWEVLKAKAGASRASLSALPSGAMTLRLSALSEFSTDEVRRAWELRQTILLKALPEAVRVDTPDRWIRELWTTHLIVEDIGESPRVAWKVPYKVLPSGGVVFEEPTRVTQVWVDTPDTDSLTPEEQALLADVLIVEAN